MGCSRTWWYTGILDKKNFRRRLKSIAEQFHTLIDGEEKPACLTKGRMIFSLKDAKQGHATDNYNPISCLPLTWRLPSVGIAKEQHTFFDENNVTDGKKRGQWNRCRCDKDQSLIDKMVRHDCKHRIKKWEWREFTIASLIIWLHIRGSSKA